jgi:Flp pilus assembly pilin Flp
MRLPTALPRLWESCPHASSIYASGEFAKQEITMFRYLWNDETGQDIAEYAVRLAVVLVIVVGTVRMIGEKSMNVFSNVASQLTQ